MTIITKIWPFAGLSQSRRPDSNRGHLHYERKRWRFRSYRKRKARPRNPCKSTEVWVYARDAPRSGEVNLVDAQWMSHSRRCWGLTGRHSGDEDLVRSTGGSEACEREPRWQRRVVERECALDAPQPASLGLREARTHGIWVLDESQQRDDVFALVLRPGMHRQRASFEQQRAEQRRTAHRRRDAGEHNLDYFD